MELPERERKLWQQLQGERASEGVPLAVCSTITPLPFWAVIVAIVIFIPLALVFSFFVRRQAIVVGAGRIVVLELSFWRFRVIGERELPLEPGALELDGNALVLAGERYHLQPGWRPTAERIVALTGQ